MWNPSSYTSCSLDHYYTCVCRCVFELSEAVHRDVKVHAVGVLEFDKSIPEIRTATCGPPASRLNYDTRLIRRAIENSDGQYETLQNKVVNLRKLSTCGSACDSGEPEETRSTTTLRCTNSSQLPDPAQPCPKDSPRSSVRLSKDSGKRVTSRFCCSDYFR